MNMVWAVVYGDEFEDGFLINEMICCMCDTEESAQSVLQEESSGDYGKDFHWEIVGYPLNIPYIQQRQGG